MRELYYLLDLGADPLLDMILPTKNRHNSIHPNNINPELIKKLKKINLLPVFRYTLRIDGTFTDELQEKLGMDDGFTWRWNYEPK